MAFTRRALALAGIVMFWLFVLVGSGLIAERAVLLLFVAGLVVPAILCAVLARLWEPGGLMVAPSGSAQASPVRGPRAPSRSKRGG